MDMSGPRRERQRDAADPVAELVHRTTLTRPARAPCRDRTYVLLCLSASRLSDRALQVGVDAVRGMPFKWSLNPYMGCVHRCTFCYVRHFEQRADRPSDHRYGRSIRIKPNVAEVLRRELARPSWKHDEVALGTATDPYQPAEGAVPAHAFVHPGARCIWNAALHRHTRPSDRPRHRRPPGGRA